MVDHHERFILLDRVIVDRELSHEARFLYCYLDRRAGREGKTHRKRQTIADELGWSVRQVSLYIRELEDHGYLVSEKLRYSQEYTLAWHPDLRKTATLGSVQTCGKPQGCVAENRKADPTVSLYEFVPLVCPSTIEVGRSVEASSTAAPDRPTDPPDPALEEPTTPEDQLLIGLANRDVWTDVLMVTRAIELLPPGMSVEDFLLRVLDPKIRRKRRLHQEFDPAWLLQAARDAVTMWRTARLVQARRPQRARVGLESVAIA